MHLCALSYPEDYDDVRHRDRDNKQGRGRERRREVEKGSLETCSVGLLQQRRLIRADKGEIRRFKIEKVVCGHCTNGLTGTEGKQTGGREREGKRQYGEE